MAARRLSVVGRYSLELFDIIVNKRTKPSPSSFLMSIFRPLFQNEGYFFRKKLFFRKENAKERIFVCFQACNVCCETYHRGHPIATIRSQTERLRHELSGMKYNLDTKISQIGDLFTDMDNEKERMIFDTEYICRQLQEEADRRISQVKASLKERTAQFDLALEGLKTQIESLRKDQLFLETLYAEGNDFDQLSRVPGMKEMIRSGKQFSGKKLELDILRWEFELNQNQSDMTNLFNKFELAEMMVEDEGAPFAGLQHTCTRVVPASCKPRDTRTVTLFNEQHIIHACEGVNSDQICLHNTTATRGAVEFELIPVPGMKQGANPVVVDAASGVLVVAEQEVVMGEAIQDHFSGSLHWLTLSKNNDVIEHEVTPLQCVQRGFMNVDSVGHLLVLTHCTSGEHPKQLLVYDNTRRVLNVIALPDVIVEPQSAVSIDPDNNFAVVDAHINKVIWIDKCGQVLRQYRPSQEINHPLLVHGIQHSSGSLLIADWNNDRIHEVSHQGRVRLLQFLLQPATCKRPFSLHLDEQAGLLSVVQVESGKPSRAVMMYAYMLCEKRVRKIYASVNV